MLLAHFAQSRRIFQTAMSSLWIADRCSLYPAACIRVSRYAFASRVTEVARGQLFNLITGDDLRPQSASWLGCEPQPKLTVRHD